MQDQKKEYLKVTQWREKAKEQRLEKEKYKKRLKEVKLGREKWKEKYKKEKEDFKILEKEYVALKRKAGLKDGERVKRHQYNVDQMQLCLQLRVGAKISLRSCVRILKVWSMILGIELFSPSINTIRNWESKLGYYQLKNGKPSTGEWVLIIDESVMVGQQKVLLILGVNLDLYTFGKALDFSDIEVLSLRVGTSCKSEDISKCIQQIQEREYRIKYAVTDNGLNIVKALRMSEIHRIEDSTHAIGLLIEKRYKEQVTFQQFMKRSALFKRQISMSKYAAMMPPVQRSKARFLNLSKVSEWANKILKLARSYENQAIHQEAFEKIKWILEYELMIEDILTHHRLMNQILKVLKVEGLGSESIEKCQEVLLKSLVAEEFKEAIKSYLIRNSEGLEEGEKCICSSDIIESMFGSFKNKMSSNKNTGFTQSALTIANISKNLEKDRIKKSMEAVKISDIEQWAKENLKPSLLKQKKELFKYVG